MSAAVSWSNNCTDAAVSLSASSAPSVTHAIDTAYPGANAADPGPSRLCRVNYELAIETNKDQILIANWTTDRSVRVVAAINCRFASNITGSIGLSLLNAAGVSQWSASFLRSNLSPIVGTSDRFHLFAILPSTVSANRFRLSVLHPSSGVSGYWEVGTLWAADALVFDDGVGRNWRQGYIDGSTVARSPSGGLATYRRDRRRRLSIPLAQRQLTRAQAIGSSSAPTAPSLRLLALEAGLSSPVVVIPRDSDQAALDTLALYGVLSRLPDVGHLGGDYFGADFEVDEWR